MMAKNEMIRKSVFDYSAVSAETKSQLIWYAAEINRQALTHVESGIEMGRLLAGARELCGSGKAFGEWVQRECGHSLRSAYNYIAAYENFGSCANFAQLELSAMYALTKNEQAKKRALKLADKGIKVTHDIAKQLVADANEKVEESDDEPVEEVAEEADEAESDVAVESEPDSDEIIDVEAAANPSSQSPPPREPSAESVDYGVCPNCKGKKWTVDEFGVNCAKCNHPHGEPLGDVDEQRIREQRSKTIKTVEAAMRAFDDLQEMRPNSVHGDSIALCKQLLGMAKGWK